MHTVYRLSRSYYRLGWVSFAFNSLMLTLTAVAIWHEPQDDKTAFVVAFPCLLWLCFIAMSLWMIQLYRKSRIILEGSRLTVRGIFREFSLCFDDVTLAKWSNRRTLHIRSAISGGRIEFEVLPPPKLGELIQVLHHRVRPDVQRGWNDEWQDYMNTRAVPVNEERRHDARRGLYRFTVATGFVVGLLVGVGVQVSNLDALPFTGNTILDWMIYGTALGLGLAAMLSGITWATSPNYAAPDLHSTAD